MVGKKKPVQQIQRKKSPKFSHYEEKGFEIALFIL
jgi:hypothetical protein